MDTHKMRTIIARKFDPRRGKFVNHAVDSNVYNKSTVRDGAPQTDMDNGTYTIGRKDRRRGPRMGPTARRDRRSTLIWINHDTVSNVHAELDVLNGRFFLRDLNSTNGTFVEKEGKKLRLQEGYVEIDQVLFLGECRCTVRELLDRL